MAEPADINVDELRRRARRRLVGAVVLALAVAVIVPMLLESQPKPLGDDVSVKIPPVDDGKFVNQLSSGSTADAAKASGAGSGAAPGGEGAKAAPADAAGAVSAASTTATAPAASTTATAPAASATSPTPQPAAAAKPPKYDTHVPEGSGSNPATGSAATAPAPVEARPTAAPVSAAAAPAVHSAAPAAHAAAPVDAATPGHAGSSARETYAVQLAAFSDDKGANALAHRLKKAGYSAYTEPLKTSKGTLWRVRVGPYPSRDAATAARDRLKHEGHSGIVAPAG
ncbi:MAG TPA: SPOR domain-containing protein [Casimicrobiaceae bacterium]|nr:SPOR domain-containing protein [Casimicrobiaceae bacterium]